MDAAVWESMHAQVRSSYADSMYVFSLDSFDVDSIRRVFCKKGCDADSDSWEDCVSDCSEICYKDPVLKDRQWSAYIDRSPGAASYSEECFHACVAGCGYKFEVGSEEVDKYQTSSPPTESHSPPGKMMSFFGDSRSSPPPSQLLPKATDTDGGDDDTWWRDGAANRREHVMRHVFLAASIICGVSGVALLVVFTLVYFFRYRNQSPSNLPCNDLK
ncbi:hypothetical protein YC2023_001373 [Brassica napus]